MPGGGLKTHREGGVLSAAFGRPGDPLQQEALAEALDDLQQALLLDASVRVLVLAGAAAGAFRIDAQAWPALPEGEGPVLEGCGRSLAEPVAALEIPVVAAIAGDAFGPGLELALACDVRIAEESGRFALPQITAGRLPCDGGTQRLARLVGRGKALEMILTGQPFDAQEALRIGLVNRIVPAGEAEAAAQALAKDMAAKAPVSLRYIKEAVRAGMEMTLEQGLRLEADLYLLLHTTRDRQEGIGAFHRRQAPRFEGR